MTKTAPKPVSAFGLARRCLFSPSEAAAASRAPGALPAAAWIYAAFLLATAVFYAWKPFDFPERNAAFPREAQGFAFWIKVMLWQPPLELAWVAFLIGLVQWFRDGKLFPRILGAAVAAAIPFVLLVLYRMSGLPWAAYFALSAAWFAGMAWLARRAPREDWAPVAALMLALNIVGLAMLAPMALAVALDSTALFQGAQIAGGLWVLGCATLGLRALTRHDRPEGGLRLPRCFMAVLLSMFMQIAFAFTLHMLGLVPKDILKALLYA